MRPASLSDWLAASLDKQGEEPVYRQLQRHLHEAILSHRLAAGSKLPSSRLLAQELGIARNTVTEVYAHLTVAGYVTSRSGSGTYVAATAPETLAGETPMSDGAVPAPGRALSVRGRRLVDGVGFAPTQWGAFMPGVPDVTEFPSRVWSRLSNRHWRRPAPSLLTYAPSGGHGPLRKVLAEHLRTSRGVRCQPEQIVITTGAHQAIDLAARLLADPGERVWIEEPSYWGIRSVLRSLGLELEARPADGEGMTLPSSVSGLPGGMSSTNSTNSVNGSHGSHGTNSETPPALILLTPSHQYPLGMVMSLARRRAWLDYARQHGSWIIEDDYDSEFRYGSRPLECLQGLDTAGRVIYVGSFSKTLFPGLRIGYVVVPDALVDAFAKGAAELYREGQLQQQAILADFIFEGHLSSHIRRMRGLYGQRRELLKEAVAQRFGNALPVSGDDAGLHLVVDLPPGSDDGAVARAALARGIAVRPLRPYYMNPSDRTGLLLGYACVPDAQIGPAFGILSEVIEPLINDPSTPPAMPTP
ncbi:PLP-dependent aminotransferase family protein [Pigmentiphaga aceris]|uniref:PLP-dependent aminotransferase family protein n=1 Tax=Pigmentiphaga aceris TaxID=1940612 RepID=A0A5C0B777_9BURK|nr:PLP-dependent aminotransferase family protein [Pigmentiphaga aceris]QEI08567.1 PLP-dependent aminotransferase family protein [Pigmentiphaga aceris]